MALSENVTPQRDQKRHSLTSPLGRTHKRRGAGWRKTASSDTLGISRKQRFDSSIKENFVLFKDM